MHEYGFTQNKIFTRIERNNELQRFMNFTINEKGKDFDNLKLKRNFSQKLRDVINHNVLLISQWLKE